jgi:hypothetical protein
LPYCVVGRTREQLERLGPYEGQSETLGPVLHGTVTSVFLFRRGVGPSADQGESAIDAMNREFTVHGQDATNALQMELLEGRELDDARTALAFVRPSHHGPAVLPGTHQVRSNVTWAITVWTRRDRQNPPPRLSRRESRLR